MSRVLELICHPETPCGAEVGLSVRIERDSGGRLALRYRVAGDVEKLSFAPVGDAVRADGLWQASCFELFVKAPGVRAYREYNFAPSRQWAAYAFTDYREGMENAEVSAPEISVDHAPHRCDIVVRLMWQDKGPLRIGLSAVVQEKEGRISYWALAHPAGKADFHDPACFAFDLAAPSAS